MVNNNRAKELIDANVIVDLLTKRDPFSYKIALKIFTEIQDEQREVIIIHGVLIEVYFVLNKHYKQSKKHIIEACIKILGLKNIINPQKDLLIQALQDCVTHNIDIVDSILLGFHKQDGVPVLTFDKKLLELTQG